MSVVTSIILIFDSSEERTDKGQFVIIENINKWLKSHGHGEIIKDVDDCTNGSKFIWGEVRICGFNHFPKDEFIKMVFAENWEEPYAVQLLTQHEHEDFGKYILYERDPIYGNAEAINLEKSNGQLLNEIEKLKRELVESKHDCELLHQVIHDQAKILKEYKIANSLVE